MSGEEAHQENPMKALSPRASGANESVLRVDGDVIRSIV
jgi:hypothetical protein